MSKEGVPLQADMFSGELVDARSDYQKKKDKERTAPQQIQMFRTPEIVQVGRTVKSAYQEWIDQATAPPLVLELVETRTPEEIERDKQREAEALTVPMFGEDKPTAPEAPVNGATSADVPLWEFPPPGVGFRLWQRQKSVNLRRRFATPNKR
jgi:hypothetical protein